MGQSRSAERHIQKVPEEEERFTEHVVSLTSRYGRYGYRGVTALLRKEGGGESQAGGDDHLTAGGIESAPEAAETGASVAQRWILYPSPADEEGPCLEVDKGVAFVTHEASEGDCEIVLKHVRFPSDRFTL
jgi:hypothetical protein